jgi:hypothetical protein
MRQMRTSLPHRRYHLHHSHRGSMKTAVFQAHVLRRFAAVVTIAAIPLWLAGAGLGAYFTGDDMMNLYAACQKPWRAVLLDNVAYFSPAYRPLGQLFYRSLFDLFGFNPLPFRVACFAILFVNLGLLYALARRLTSSREIALLTVLLGCYHRHFADLYYNTGTIYDLLCFTFYVAALLLYARWRDAGRYLRWGEILVLVALYACALNAKEMAVTLPVTLLLYEFVYHRPNRVLKNQGRAVCPVFQHPWCARAAGVAALLAVLTVPYIASKLSAASPLAQVPHYQVHANFQVYLDSYRRYLDYMFYCPDGWFTRTGTVLLLGGMLIGGLLSRRKELLFSSVFVIYSVLPVSFIPPRGTIFVLYVPYIGWCLFAATVALAVRDRIAGLYPPSSRPRLLSPTGTFAVLALCLFLLHRAHTFPLPLQSTLSSTMEQMRALVPQLPAKGRVLFLDDPFPPNEFTLLMAVRLRYRDNTLEVYRAKTMSPTPNDAEINRYDVVLTCQDGRVQRVH